LHALKKNARSKGDKPVRLTYLVAYDISDPKRLRRVHRTMRGYGDALQLSVFRCQLSATERILMIEALTKVINTREDQILIVNLGPAEQRGANSIETLGRAFDNIALRSAIIV
jgi:CRISPR-associated protein Cas2